MRAAESRREREHLYALCASFRAETPKSAIMVLTWDASSWQSKLTKILL